MRLARTYKRVVCLAMSAGLGFGLTSCAVNDEPVTIGSLNDRQIVVSKDTVDVETTRSKAIQAYRELVNESSSGEVGPESLRRLADLRLEQDEDTLDTLDPQVQTTTVSAAQKQAYAESISLYQRALTQYPDHQKNDQVLYQLARAYENTGRREKALATLDQLVSRYPNSPYISEAQFRRGEILFVDRRYREAEGAYKAVIAMGEQNPFYEHSLYKVGWSQFKQTNYRASLDPFMTLLQRKYPGGRVQTDIQTLSRPDQELIDDTLRAISLNFSYQDGVKTLNEYYRSRQRDPYEDIIYARLGDFYVDKEQYSDAAKTYQAFVERNPEHRFSPLYQAKVIDAYQKGDFPTEVLDAKKQYVQRYRLDAPYWKKYAPADNPQVVATLKTNVTDLANHYHAQAQSSKKTADYNEAETWYRTYLESFPQDPKAAGMNFLLAEALYETQRYGFAALEYEKTAYQYQQHEKSAEAGYAALVAFEQYEKNAPAGNQPEIKERAITSTLRFADKFPQHPKAATVLTDAAEDLFRLQRFAAAGDVAERVVTQYPNAKPELRRTAWTVIAHSAFDGSDYLRAESAYQQVLSLTAVDAKQRTDLQERLAASIYKQAEGKQKAGNTLAAVEDYLRVGQVVPSATIRATAEYDAAAALMQLKDWSRAASVLEVFRGRYPEHKLQPEVTRRLAVAYQQGGQPLKAAAEFERIGEMAGTDPQLRQQAILQAVDLYSQGGQSSRAAGTLEKYIAQFPQPVEQAIEARQQLVTIYSKQGNTGKARYWQQEIIVADQTAGSQRTPRTRSLAAGAVLALAEVDHKAYRQVRLVEPLKQSLASKKVLMQKAIAAYGKAADYDIQSVTTAATFQTGSIYHDFSRALMDSQRPRNLSGDELEQYEILLEEQAFPFEEKAIEIYEVNIKRIADGVYDKWVKSSQLELAKLLPARYNKMERGESVVESIQ